MSRFHFFILVLLVSISGFSQGLLLPVFLKQMENPLLSTACTRPGCISVCFWLRRLWKRRSESSGSSR